MDCCTTDYPHGGHGHGKGRGHGHGHGRSRSGGCCCGCDCGCHGGRSSECCDEGDYGRGDLGPGGFQRRYLSPQEELEILEEYLAELKNETAGVEAEIKRLKKEK